MRRTRHPALAALPLMLALALAGCGGGLTGAGVNTNGPTQTAGQVTIATDHGAYGTSDSIKITIVNHRTTPIYAYDTKASCSVLSVEVQQGGQWLPANALRCPLGRMALAVKIDAGGTYQTTIGPAIMRIGSIVPLSDGSYRLALEYFDAPFGASATPPTSTLVYSATLIVSGAA